MSTLTKATTAVVCGVAAAIFLAVPASAEPGDNPCDLAVNYFCKFIPIAPELEGNVDLTQQQPPVDPAAPPPESLPVVDPCAAGCV
jgi:hypothetical protein